MNILLVSSNYPGSDIPKDITPVAHYFAKEWVSKGHSVHVIHCQTVFPSFLYPILKLFRKKIMNKYGGSFLLEKLNNRDYNIDGVNVHRRTFFKIAPSFPFLDVTTKKSTCIFIKELIGINFFPDVIAVHWDEPGYHVIKILKEYYKKPILFVAHGVSKLTKHSKEAFPLIDTIGYRSLPIKKGIEKRFNAYCKTYFMCYSGIPSKLIPENCLPVYNREEICTYVGTLVARKHPDTLIRAVSKNPKYNLNFIGDGAMRDSLQALSTELNIINRVRFYGRIPREKVCEVLAKTKVFVMVSKNETFGLVYIEAMANGCITIASRNEGMDGIIIDGVNGFLCKAGDEVELASILKKISLMTDYELNDMSYKARETANDLTDEKVGDIYLQEMAKLVEHPNN